MRHYKSRTEDPSDPYQAQPLPIGRPVAVYYRQSSEAQIGNISTTLQTVDMVEHLVSLGWMNEQVIMIDMDAGISGTKAIEDRPGMSELMNLIEGRVVGAVAAQDVDRFFRDVTQIQTNLFIDACRRNNVMVLTPTMVFDFNHPLQGRYHIQMFRDQAERAADYLEYHIRGRLVKSRHWRSQRGLWSGRKVATGYMVDDRKFLPDGERNPDYRKYALLEPYAEVIRAYFKLFRDYNGCVDHTWAHIQEHGPFFPEFDEAMLPEGFKYKQYALHRSEITGKLCPAKGSIRSYLTKVVYLGHWIHKGVIVEWNNHTPLVDEELFMYAFNSISPTDFHGEPNPDYAPYRTYKPRQLKHDRTQPYPTYAGLLFSDDLPNRPHQRLAAVWNAHNQLYQYNLYIPNSKGNVWNIKAHIVDPIVDQMLLERLKATTLDETLWEQALSTTQQGNYEEIRRLDGEIKREKQAQDNIIVSLGKLSNEEMIFRAQAQYEAAARRIEHLKGELEQLKVSNQREKSLLRARPALLKIAEHWEYVPSSERRHLFQEFAHYIQMTRLSRNVKQVTIHWRDGSSSSEVVSRFSIGHYWDQGELQELKELIERPAQQIEILAAFPGYSWRNLMEKYAYHFGSKGKNYSGLYQGKLVYPRDTRWADICEHQTQNSPELLFNNTWRTTFCVTACETKSNATLVA